MDRAENASDWSDETAPTEAWLFAQLILGKPIPKVVSPEARARAKREELERLARFSSRHSEELSRIKIAEADARSERESLEWAAQISTRAEEKLRALLQMEAEEREAWRRAEAFYEKYVANVTEGSPDQPRVPAGSPQGGQWAKGGGGGQGSGSSKWYLPSSDKGEWLGDVGNSKFRLKTPIDANGKLVKEIEFRNGAPVLDKFAVPGKTATIILTGDRDADVAHAKDAWQKLNPGKPLPGNAAFHHDLLNVTEHIADIGGKPTTVLVGKVPAVPTEIHGLFHQGSHSAAARFYEGMGEDATSAIRALSKKQASLAGTGTDFVSAAAKKIKPGTIAKGLAPFVGRTVLKALPLVNAGLALAEFGDNVQAHGLGGAIIRATPVLSDVVGAYDIGTDLAKQITDEAKASMSAHHKAINEPVDQAREEANKQTLDALDKLGSKIQITNTPESGTGRLVDPEEIKDALDLYHGRMVEANQLRIEKKAGFDYNAAAAENMRALKKALEHAAQKRAPVKPAY